MEEHNQGSLESLMTQELNNLPVLFPGCSIFRVPGRLCDVDEKAYTPKVVSIGPLHHGVEALKAMEEHKKRYLKDFIKQTQRSLGFYLEVVRKKEEELRACYAEAIRLSSDEFVKIILVDAAFIIGVLLRQTFPELIEKSDRIYHEPRMKKVVRPDMLLLENQLPFFILVDLFEIWKERVQPLVQSPSIFHLSRVQPLDQWPSIFQLSYRFFKSYLLSEEKETKLEKIGSSEVKHFVDFLRLLQLPSEEQPRGVLQKINLPTLTELQSAGVKLKVGSSENPFDLQFHEGILQIPKLKFKDSTVTLIRNLVAFEQCYRDKNYITDYIFIIDSLVNTEKDVDVLVKDGILHNYHVNNMEVLSLINRLGHGLIFNSKQFLFADLCEDLNTYYINSWHKWKANLRQNYFNTPWTIISIVTGVTFLILSLIQTVCSIISTMASNPSGRYH